MTPQFHDTQIRRQIDYRQRSWCCGPGWTGSRCGARTGAMRYRRGWARRLGMVAGGTGIMPMYQVARAVCGDPADDILRERMPQPGEGSKVMVCGSPGMVTAAQSMLAEIGYNVPGAASSMDVFVFGF
ncbi:hypothetical protein VTG60DRAFT_3006 [Thermothelomyces hinnuleus]